MSCSVKIIEDSISEEGKRITTLQLKYWRAIHGEVMTHRVFSRNASSSRAIPVNKMIEQVRNDPAGPIHWGKNIPGMQSKEELIGYQLDEAQILWNIAAENAADVAEGMASIGLHKQVANRILEPFQWMHVVVTATEFDNFFALRVHPDAQPEIQQLASMMQQGMRHSAPKLLKAGEWHLPYVTEEERQTTSIELLKKVSAARCCRVSYLKHDGGKADIEEDLQLCERLAGSIPIHASPFEHQSTPDKLVYPNGDWESPELHGNFVGWIQYRKEIESEFN